MHIYVCTHIHMHISCYIYTYIHTYMRMSIRINTHTRACAISRRIGLDVNADKTEFMYFKQGDSH